MKSRARQNANSRPLYNDQGVVTFAAKFRWLRYRSPRLYKRLRPDEKKRMRDFHEHPNH